jgi:hypothetical protein
MRDWIAAALYCWQTRRIRDTRVEAIRWILTHRELINIVAGLGRSR